MSVYSVHVVSYQVFHAR